MEKSLHDVITTDVKNAFLNITTLQTATSTKVITKCLRALIARQTDTESVP